MDLLTSQESHCSVNKSRGGRLQSHDTNRIFFNLGGGGGGGLRVGALKLPLVGVLREQQRTCTIRIQDFC